MSAEERNAEEQLAHDHVEHWAQVANEAERRADALEVVASQMYDALLHALGAIPPLPIQGLTIDKVNAAIDLYRALCVTP